MTVQSINIPLTESAKSQIRLANAFARKLDGFSEDDIKRIFKVKGKKSLAERFAEYDGPLQLTEEWDFEPEGNELDWQEIQNRVILAKLSAGDKDLHVKVVAYKVDQKEVGFFVGGNEHEKEY